MSHACEDPHCNITYFRKQDTEVTLQMHDFIKYGTFI